MADKFVTNAAAGGVTFASDEIPVTLEHYPLVKLADGTPDSVEYITGTTANGIDVDVTRVSGNVTVVNGGTFATQPGPGTSGGCSIFHLVAAATTNANNVKASAGQVYGITIFNNAGYPVYVKFHNTAGAPTAGAGVVRTFGCQAGTQAIYSQSMGIAFGTGIAITIVRDITDAGATAVALSDCVLNVEYK